MGHGTVEIQTRRKRCLGRNLACQDSFEFFDHTSMLACNDHGGNHHVGITLPPAMLLAQTFHHGRTGGIEYDHVKLGKHLLGIE